MNHMNMVERRPKAMVRQMLTAAGLLLLAGAVDLGCAGRVYLRQSTVSEYDLTEGELKSLQYWTDADLRLTRIASEGTQKSTRGKLVTRYGKTYEVIELRAGTPGVATGVSSDRRHIHVSFEPGASMNFGPGTGGWSDHYPLCYTEERGGKKYQTYSGHSYLQEGAPRLLIGREAFSKIVTKRRKLPGRVLE